VDPITFEAIGDGAWGKGVAVRVENASLDPSTDPTTPKKDDLFKLTVAYWKDSLPDFSASEDLAKILEKAAVMEVYDNLSTKPTSSDYYLSKLGKPKSVSNLIQLYPEANTVVERPANNIDSLFTALTEEGAPGSDLGIDAFLGDPTADPGERRGLTAFTEVDEISILYVADLHNLPSDDDKVSLTSEIVSHCENMKDRFAILEAPKGTKDISKLWPGVPGEDSTQVDSKYAAFYYPWIEVYDPLTKGTFLVPPGGSAAGIYARSDQERGVHKAPANEVIRGATDLEFKITKGEQGILNPRGVNCIRVFPGRGIRVWGARTTSSDTLWKYINVRRLFLFLEESIEEGTQWVVFEPNDEKLWARVRQTITQFLTRVWKDGALMGTTSEEAFFVKCDRTTMTQDDIDNGRLIVLIGVAPVKPAEFVIFRIAQWAGGSAVTE
jgi:hypothetical protein